jgi:hypothetical protein
LVFCGHYRVLFVNHNHVNVKISKSFYLSHMNDLFDYDAILNGNEHDPSDCEYFHDCDVSNCFFGYRAFLLELLYCQNLSLRFKLRVNVFLYKVFHDDVNFSVPMNAGGLHDDGVNTHDGHHSGHYARYLR